METHVIERETFPCEICGKRLYKDNMRGHLQIHDKTNSKFECSVCKKRFFKKSAYLYHCKVHTVEPREKFSCDKCPKQFINKKYLLYTECPATIRKL